MNILQTTGNNKKSLSLREAFSYHSLLICNGVIGTDYGRYTHDDIDGMFQNGHSHADKLYQIEI